MNETPKNTETPPSLIDRLSDAMKGNSGNIDKVINYNQDMVTFNSELEAKYGRQVLGCVKEWHKMIGSSVSSVDGYGGEDSIDADTRDQILEDIGEFVSQYE